VTEKKSESVIAAGKNDYEKELRNRVVKQLPYPHPLPQNSLDPI
jgi:hypothetical protein